MNKNYLIGIIIVVLLGGLLYIGLNKDDQHADHDHKHDEHHHDEPIVAKDPIRADGTFSIATSFYPLQFALERIVGDLAVVTNIGAGVDPHDFSPTTQDIAILQAADLVVLQGTEFEPWGDAVEHQLDDAGVPVVLATAEIKLHEAGDEHHDEHEENEDDGHNEHEDEDEHAHEEDEHGHQHGAYDPHTWLDPVLFGESVEHLTEAIVSLDPESAAIYEANAADLQADLATLHNTYKSTLATCTLDEVITSHDAFGYIAERYDFEIHAIGGLSTQDTPSVTTLATLKGEAGEGVGGILLEENSIAAYGETLARETGLTTYTINPISYIIPTGEDYLTLMQKNLNSFSATLNCNG